MSNNQHCDLFIINYKDNPTGGICEYDVNDIIYSKEKAIKAVISLMNKYNIIPQDFIDEFNKLRKNYADKNK